MSAVVLLLAFVGVAKSDVKILWVDQSGNAITREVALATLEAKGGSLERLATSNGSLVFMVLTGGTITPPAPPVDQMKAAIEKAYASETATDKAVKAKQLSDLFTQGAEQVKTTDKTTKQFLAAMRDAANGLIGAGSLPLVREAIAGELDKILPAKDGPWDAGSRSNATSTFSNISKVLGGLK